MLSKKIKNLIHKYTQKDLFASTLSFLKSFVLRLVIQGVYFVILARTFSPEKYGAYVGIVAIISILIPFANWGSGLILVQEASRNKERLKEFWGTAILKSLLFGSLLTILILIIYSFSPINHISIFTVFFIAIANLIFFKIDEVARQALIAVGLLSYAARALIILSVNRFVASVAFVFISSNASVLNWSILYCLATFASAVMSSLIVIKQVGLPKFNFSAVTQNLKLGFSFAIGVSAQNIYNDLDKSMLAKLSTLQATGIYGAAYQILNVAFAPVQSLAIASFRNFFQQGASGIKGSFELCKKLLPVALGYSLLAIFGLVICSPLITLILGTEYQESAWALVWLSPTIFFRTIHFFAADTLTGANYQGTRSIAQVLVAIFNGLLNFLLIPIYGWYGAIWATIASEFLLMVILGGAIYKYSHQAE